MSVLQVGVIEPALARALAAKYQTLQLPNDPTRNAFLAQHAASVTAVVDFGPPGVDADLMKSLLFGISPLDPLTYAAVPVVLVAATVLASYLPARRAAITDPVEALRSE